MEPPAPRSNTPAAGGCLLALGIAAGAAYGLVAGNASIALLVGAAVGIVAATVVFVIDRRR